MEKIMTARSVAWDTGEAIPGTYFRHMIRTADTGGRFSSLSAILGPGDLTPPHSHRDEDEFTFVFRGRIGGRVGDHDVGVEEGGFLFKPRGIVHTLWNPTDVEAIVIGIISPPGLEDFFEEIGGLSEGASPEAVPEIGTRYGLTFHPELIAELSALYGVSP
jgi:mannose-6-phosphate isomerase-like protein (cupin superfamily)